MYDKPQFFPSQNKSVLPMNELYRKERFNSLEALNEAQKLAFAPIAFQTVRSLKELNILKALDTAGKQGALVETLAEQTKVSSYGVRVLLDMGLSIGLVYRNGERYVLGKMGELFEHDEMTQVNLDFTQHVCYKAMEHLSESIVEQKPAGLKELGDWPTIYPGLSALPKQAKTAWHEFDHHYSDRAFGVALPLVFREKPRLIFDIGGNTGKWALKCVNYDPDVKVTILDLPQQLAVAKDNVAKAGFADRVEGLAVDMLDSKCQIPGDADVYWMSQFLDCFSEAQIVSILQRVAEAMKPGAKVYILELFWDSQEYEAASYSLNATSLYFTALANGNSRFYEKAIFTDLIKQSGLQLDEEIDGLSQNHTLLVCSKA